MKENVALYIKFIFKAFKNNITVLWKIAVVLTALMIISYTPYLVIVYMIRTLCILFAVMILITLTYIGVTDANRIKRWKKEK